MHIVYSHRCPRDKIVQMLSKTCTDLKKKGTCAVDSRRKRKAKRTLPKTSAETMRHVARGECALVSASNNRHLLAQEQCVTWPKANARLCLGPSIGSLVTLSQSATGYQSVIGGVGGVSTSETSAHFRSSQGRPANCTTCAPKITCTTLSAEAHSQSR